ncbi:MAG: tRNA (adenosine(37)-N6)-dimethylallyltransferase MiaA [Balneolaceae bacterium]
MRIILLGPTASGKTDLSLLLAERLNTSIISADSRQCYKHIDIGTAKPSRKELQQIPHYNISVLELDEEDSAMEFQKRAAEWEKEILQHSDHVLHVGGSTLHVQSLIQPFNDMPNADPHNIEQLERRIEDEGLESLYGMLKEIDPAYIKRMDGMNRQRIIRALDIWMQTGKTFSSFHRQDEIQPDRNTLVFGLKYLREVLYKRINKRVDEMIAQGLVEEVESILGKGYSSDSQALNTVGYKEILKALEGEWPLDKAVEKIKTSTRRYAKRQLTWYRRWEFIHWLPAGEKEVEELANIILAKVES